MPLMNSSSPYAYGGTPTSYSDPFDPEEYRKWMLYFTQNGISNPRLESPVLQGLPINPGGAFAGARDGGRSSFSIPGVTNEAAFRRAYEDVRKSTLKKRGEQDQPYYLQPQPRSLAWAAGTKKKPDPVNYKTDATDRATEHERLSNRLAKVTSPGAKDQITRRLKAIESEFANDFEFKAYMANRGMQEADTASKIEARDAKIENDKKRLEIAKDVFGLRADTANWNEKRRGELARLGELAQSNKDPRVFAKLAQAAQSVARGLSAETAIRQAEESIGYEDDKFNRSQAATNQRIQEARQFTMDQQSMSDIRGVTKTLIDLAQEEAKIGTYLNDPSTPATAKAEWESALAEIQRIKQQLQAHADALQSGQPSPLYGDAQPPQNSGPVHVSSPEEVRALPPGTRFITPDGRTGTR